MKSNANINLNSNGNSKTRKQQGSLRTMMHSKRGRSASGAVMVFRLLLYFTAICALMPFAVSFLSIMTNYETSALERFLESSKVSSSPFHSTGHHATISAKDIWFEHSLENPPDDPYTILHTITTRFMVGQAPNITSNESRQLEIQTARFKLFETFCWPTIQRQTSMNFYWIVLVDPNLDKTILDSMKDMLNDTYFPAQNAFMVLTNNTKWSSDGVGVENSTSYGVGLQPVAQEFQEGTLEIATGNTDYLLRALDTMKGNTGSFFRSPSKKSLMVIETLLDADDGLNNGAVEWIQNAATKRTKEHWDQRMEQNHALPSLNNTWWLLCGTDHIEWHNREIFQLMEEDYNKSGITSGLAGLRQSPLFCTSAGFTRIGITRPSDSIGYRHMFFPKDGYSNHALAFYFPECTSNSSTGVGGNYSACWHREFAEKVYIVKSRTITSDSMDHLNVGKQNDYRDISWLNESDYPLLINDTERMWGILGSEFSIDRRKAWELSAYIFEHRHSIILQNKQSRCSPGFPCFKTAKRNLVRMERYWAKQKVIRRIEKKKKEAKGANATKTANTPQDSGSHSDDDGSKFLKAVKEAQNGEDHTSFLQDHLRKKLGSKTTDRHKPKFDASKVDSKAKS